MSANLVISSMYETNNSPQRQVTLLILGGEKSHVPLDVREGCGGGENAMNQGVRFYRWLVW